MPTGKVWDAPTTAAKDMALSIERSAISRRSGLGFTRLMGATSGESFTICQYVDTVRLCTFVVKEVSWQHSIVRKCFSRVHKHVCSPRRVFRLFETETRYSTHQVL